MEELKPEDLEIVIRGDLSPLPKLARHSHEDLRRAWSHSSHPKLTVRTVLRVLNALRRGEVAAKQVHEWAGFLFSGYSSSATFPLKRLDFEYDPVDEDRIAEIVMRLEQMEDAVDGPISRDELDRMISKLERRR
jgi:hypothetical protein